MVKTRCLQPLAEGVQLIGAQPHGLLTSNGMLVGSRLGEACNTIRGISPCHGGERRDLPRLAALTRFVSNISRPHQ